MLVKGSVDFLVGIFSNYQSKEYDIHTIFSKIIQYVKFFIRIHERDFIAFTNHISEEIRDGTDDRKRPKFSGTDTAAIISNT